MQHFVDDVGKLSPTVASQFGPGHADTNNLPDEQEVHYNPQKRTELRCKISLTCQAASRHGRYTRSKRPAERYWRNIGHRSAMAIAKNTPLSDRERTLKFRQGKALCAEICATIAFASTKLAQPYQP
jgi:hypothetical protein